MNKIETTRLQSKFISYLLAVLGLFLFAGRLGAEGLLGLFFSYGLYYIFILLFSEGTANVLGRIYASRFSKKQYKNADVVGRRIALIYFFTSLVLTGIFLILSFVIPAVFADFKYSGKMLLLLTPCILLRSIDSILQGFLKGRNFDKIADVAYILRVSLIVVLGLLFMNAFSDYGTKLSNLLRLPLYGELVFASSVCTVCIVSEIIVFLFLIFFYLYVYHRMEFDLDDGMRQVDNKNFTFSLWLELAGAELVKNALLCVPMFVTVFLLVNRAGSEREGLIKLLLEAACVIGIPVGLYSVESIVFSVKSAGYLKKNDERAFKFIFQNGSHLAFVNGLYLAAFPVIVSFDISNVFGMSHELDYMMAVFSPVILFAIMSIYFGVVFIRSKKVLMMLPGLFIGDAAVVVYNLFLGKNHMPETRFGVSLSLFTIGFFLTLFAIYLFVYKVNISLLREVVVPMGAVAGALLITMLLRKIIFSHISPIVTIFICYIFGLFAYWSFLLLLRDFREGELKGAYFAGIIKGLGQLLRVF
ncbi:MAG: hypothetical protein K6D96_09475 [Acetatifactor sp.]|nr:hypothetical protein [Acetatifactor sp.]